MRFLHTECGDEQTLTDMFPYRDIHIVIVVIDVDECARSNWTEQKSEDSLLMLGRLLSTPSWPCWHAQLL
jgi:hypothetical protein